MQLDFEIEIIANPIGFYPSKLHWDISEQVTMINEVPCKRVQSTSTQILTATVQDLDNTLIKTSFYDIPVSDMQQLISGYDISTGKPTIDLNALNVYMQQYNTHIISQVTN